MSTNFKIRKYCVHEKWGEFDISVGQKVVRSGIWVGGSWWSMGHSVISRKLWQGLHSSMSLPIWILSALEVKWEERREIETSREREYYYRGSKLISLHVFVHSLWPEALPILHALHIKFLLYVYFNITSQP